MINPPKTIKEALKTKYGNKNLRTERSYDIDRCAYEVWNDFHNGQCSRSIRKNGHGPGRLYCRQHAKIVGEK